MIRVLIVDDHPIVRAGLRSLIESAPDMRLMAECENGKSALDCVAKMEIDVAIMDLTMPGMAGIDVIKETLSLKPRTKVLALSVQPEDQFGTSVIRSGASGYLHKDSAPERLIEAIRTVSSGGTYVSPKLAQAMAAELRSGVAHEPHDDLTQREKEILRLLGAGNSVGQVAEQLFISAKTVSTHRANILRKLDLSTTAELIRYAIERNL